MTGTAIEVTMQPMNSVDVVSQSPPAIEVAQVTPVSVEVAIATIGPRGEKGDPGAVVGVETVIGDPNANFATMYQIFKL